LDRVNIISIDVNHDVRPDSRLILHAARQVVEEEGFDELLDNVRDRIDEIESLHRTRELTFKDLREVSVQPVSHEKDLIHLPQGDLLRLSIDKDGRRV
jgi:hypothetical protein